MNLLPFYREESTMIVQQCLNKIVNTTIINLNKQDNNHLVNLSCKQKI
jgi:hypothetical protein